MGERCGEKVCVVFQGQRGDLESQAKLSPDWTSPAVPVMYGKHLRGLVARLQGSLITPGICPTLDYSVALVLGQ